MKTVVFTGLQHSVELFIVFLLLAKSATLVMLRGSCFKGSTVNDTMGHLHPEITLLQYHCSYGVPISYINLFASGGLRKVDEPQLFMLA